MKNLRSQNSQVNFKILNEKNKYALDIKIQNKLLQYKYGIRVSQTIER